MLLGVELAAVGAFNTGGIFHATGTCTRAHEHTSVRAHAYTAHRGRDIFIRSLATRGAYSHMCSLLLNMK